MHPLVFDISSMKDQELEAKIQDLSKKYFMTSNSNVQAQIVLVLESYQAELGIRKQKQWEEMNRKGDSELDSLINVS